LVRDGVRGRSQPNRIGPVSNQASHLDHLALPMMKAIHVRARRGGLRSRSAFTLIEILVVIVVIAILATLVAPNIFRNVGEAKATTAKAQIEMLVTTLDGYRLSTGSYPTTEQGLQALYERPSIDPPINWNGPYLSKPVPLDPWQRPYYYVFPGQQNPNGFDLYSLGADGQPGGTGENADIVSWM
jgi:general secretion pathway protein G